MWWLSACADHDEAVPEPAVEGAIVTSLAGCVVTEREVFANGDVEVDISWYDGDARRVSWREEAGDELTTFLRDYDEAGCSASSVYRSDSPESAYVSRTRRVCDDQLNPVVEDVESEFVMGDFVSSGAYRAEFLYVYEGDRLLEWSGQYATEGSVYLRPRETIAYDERGREILRNSYEDLDDSLPRYVGIATWTSDDLLASRAWRDAEGPRSSAIYEYDAARRVSGSLSDLDGDGDSDERKVYSYAGPSVEPRRVEIESDYGDRSESYEYACPS